MNFGSRALIRLGALSKNLEIIRSAAADAKIMAVIKANAYGHGMLAVARHLRDVDAFAVARLPEAIELHESGIGKPIVLLAGALTAAELDEALRREFHIVVHCMEQVDMLESAGRANAVAWLKFDTGMNRLGFSTEDAPQLIARLRKCVAVCELRIMSHLASADDLSNPATAGQLSRFREIVNGFDGAVSIANTPGLLGWPEIAAGRQTLGFGGAHWIRPGLALFGISPFEGRSAADLGLTPVMQFEGRLIAVKPLRKGETVGYGGRFRAGQDSMLGVIAAGYGDGYSRHFKSGTPVLLNGRRVPLIGSVSMDMIAVDLGAESADKIGDIAVLWGDRLPVEEVAPWAGAIPYELVCGVMHREAQENVD